MSGPISTASTVIQDGDLGAPADLGANEDVLVIAAHNGTHMDALCHVYADGKIYTVGSPVGQLVGIGTREGGGVGLRDVVYGAYERRLARQLERSGAAAKRHPG